MDTSTESLPLNRYASLEAAAAAVKPDPHMYAVDPVSAFNQIQIPTASGSGSYFPLLSVPGEEALPQALIGAGVPTAFDPLSVNFTPASSPLASTAPAQAQAAPYLHSLAPLQVSTPFSPHAVKMESNTATAPVASAHSLPASSIWAYNQFYQPLPVPAPAVKHEFNPVPLSVDYLLAGANGSNGSLLPLPTSPFDAADMSPASYAMSPASPVLIPPPLELHSMNKKPVRTAKAKATDTIHQIATAKSDDDDSEASDESPQHKPIANRKRKTNGMYFAV